MLAIAHTSPWPSKVSQDYFSFCLQYEYCYQVELITQKLDNLETPPFCDSPHTECTVDCLGSARLMWSIVMSSMYTKSTRTHDHDDMS